MIDEKIITRVRQLIALATRNPEKEEARSAAVQACALIVEHKLEELFRTKGEARCSQCGHTLVNVLCGVCARETIFGRWRRAPVPQPSPARPPRKHVQICRICGQSDVPEGTVVGGYCTGCRPFGEWILRCSGCDVSISAPTSEAAIEEANRRAWRTDKDGHSYCSVCRSKL